jgi:hypothetical protein
MVGVRRPIGFVIIDLISPLIPPATTAAGEKFQKGPRTAPFDQIVDFVGLAGMFAFLRRNEIDLRSTRLQRAEFSPDTEQEKFRRIPKVKADTAAIGTTVLTYFVPHEIRFVFEPPSLKTASPSGSKAFGTHKYRWLASRTASAIGMAQISSRDIVS